MEAEHLGGDVDMVAVVQTLLNEQDRRRAAGERDWCIPFAQTTDGSCLMMFTRRRTPATRRSAVCAASPNCAASSLHFRRLVRQRRKMATHSSQLASLSNTTLRSLPSEICPRYDRNAIKTGIIHLGVGAFHRAHQAVYTEAVLASGDLRWGIVGASLRGAQTRDALAPEMVSTPWQSVARLKGFK